LTNPALEHVPRGDAISTGTHRYRSSVRADAALLQRVIRDSYLGSVLDGVRV
jgi:hypothetical protein